MAPYTKVFILLTITTLCHFDRGHTEGISHHSILMDGVKRAQQLSTRTNEQYEAVRRQMESLEQSFHPLPAVDTATGRLGAVVGGHNVSDACYNDTQDMWRGLSAYEIWAILMFDAQGKPESNTLLGNTGWLGSYDECRDIEAVVFENFTTRTTVKTTFNGQYCILRLPSFISMLPQIDLGVCYPDSCSTSDVVKLTNAVLQMQNKSVESVICQEKSVEFDDKAIGAVIVCGFILAMMIVGTLYDVVVIRSPLTGQVEEANNIPPKADTEQTKKEKTPLVSKEFIPPPKVETKLGVGSNILLAFSVYTNGEKLLNTKMPPGSLTALNGIRFLSMSWVILGHTYSSSMSVANNLVTFLPKMQDRWTFQAIFNALVSVDTFFTLSGLLVSYLFMREMTKKQGRINWGLFYFHRFWRLTPPYMLVLFMEVTLTRYFANGPFWPKDGFERNFCEDTWWKNLLYVNNLVKSEDQCMGWSWYMANDMQFFVISPLMLVPLYYSKVIGMAVCLAFLLGVFITAGLISSTNNLPVNFFIAGFDNGYFDLYYIKPYTRMGPYIVGIMAGYLLYKSNLKFKMNKIFNLIGWCVAIVLACVVLYGLYEPMKGSTTLSTEVAALYNAVHRSIWGACVCWVIFACANGYGGFINTLLSWRGFVPLSRLTYCAYLIHPIVISVVYFSRRSLLHLDDITMISYFFTFLLASYLIAFVVSLAFESPMMGLEKAIFKKEKSS